MKPELFQWRFRLGIARWALGGLGALTVFVSRLRRSTTLFFALAATVCIFLMLPVSSPIWQRSPLVYLQLPWRWLGPAAVALGVLAGAPDGKLWGQSDKLNPASGLPTNRWPLGDYMPDSHLATLRPDAPPGEYRVVAGLWDRYSGRRMHVLDAQGVATGLDGVVLTTTFKVQP